MRIDWKRSMAALLGTGVIALTAACGSEVSGAAQGGSPAVVSGASSGQASTDAPSTEAEPTEAEPSVADPTEEEPTETQPSVAEPWPSPATETESTETESTDAEPTEADPTGTSEEGGGTSSSGRSDADYAFTEDYCTLMPESFVAGLEKDTTRDPDQSCTYLAPDSSDEYGFVSITGGFALSKEDLDESYNVDLAEVDIDGREGFTWTNSTQSNYSALFNLPRQDGGEMSILVVFGSDGSPAEMKKQALALLAEISPKVPR